ncbi:MAG TPA: hypothetical protein VF837_04315 [Patescibacteria group bacterium]
MLLLALLAILAIGLGLYWSIKEHEALCFFGCVIAAMFIFLIFGLIAQSILPTQPVLSTSYSLRAASNDPQLQGSFFLGSGTIKDVQKIGYFYQVAEQQYKYAELSFDDSVTIVTDVKPGATSHIDYYTCPLAQDWERLLWFDSGKTCGTQIHVPDNAVANYLIFKP